MQKIPLNQDGFTRGLIAGAIAGLVKDIPSLIIHIFRVDIFPTYWDYSGMIGMGKIPITVPEIILCIIVELGFSMALGTIAIFLISRIKSHHYLIEGTFFGIMVWFVIRAIVWIFNVPGFNNPQMMAFVINATTSAIFGLLIAYFDHRFQSDGK